MKSINSISLCCLLAIICLSCKSDKPPVESQTVYLSTSKQNVFLGLTLNNGGIDWNDGSVTYAENGDSTSYGNYMKKYTQVQNHVITIKSDKIETLYCPGDNLTQLNLSGCQTLQRLHCEENLLTTLNTATNPNIYRIKCEKNQLTSLVLSSNVNLEELSCDSNNIKILDVRCNVKLKKVTALGNPLDTIYVKKGCSFNYSLPETTKWIEVE